MPPSSPSSRSTSAERPRRKLWRVDLNDVRVQDEDGREFEVLLTRGVLDGCLTVTVGVDSADKSGPRRVNDRAHGHREDDSQ